MIPPAEFLLYLRSDAPKAAELADSPYYVQLWEEADLTTFNREYGLSESAPGFFGFGSDGDEWMLAFDPAGRIQALPMAELRPEHAFEVCASWSELESRMLENIDPDEAPETWHTEEDGYVQMAWLGADEARKLLLGLEQAGVRFRCRTREVALEIDPAISAQGGAFGQNAKLLVLVHSEDLERYHEIYRRIFLPEPPSPQADWRDRLRGK